MPFPSYLGIFTAVYGVIINLFKVYNGDDWEGHYESIMGYGVGGSGRVGGGIYPKAADVGVDLVGKIEKSIPEDDPRNPAVINDNVGDNVGDIEWALISSGLMSRHLALLSCRIDIVLRHQPQLLRHVLPSHHKLDGDRGLPNHNTLCHRALRDKACERNRTVAKAPAPYLDSPNDCRNRHGDLLRSAVGVHPLRLQDQQGFQELATLLLFRYRALGWTRDWVHRRVLYKHAYSPVQDVADSCCTGAATNVIFGLALGYKSVIIPIFAIAVAIYISFSLAAMYGISMAALGMLSTIATGLAIDAYGPISDNAGGIVEMAGMSHWIRERTNAVDAARNTTAAIGKGFAIGSAALVSLALFGAFVSRAGIETIDVLTPEVFIGLLVGAMLPYWFSAMTMKSVGSAALKMVEEVRRQSNTIPGLMEGLAKPDYANCIKISTDASLREMIPPGALVMLTPLVAGTLFSVETLAGVLAVWFPRFGCPGCYIAFEYGQGMGQREEIHLGRSVRACQDARPKGFRCS